MKTLFFAIFIGFGFAFGQQNCEITKHLESFITIEISEHDGSKYFSNDVIAPDSSLCFSEVIRLNHRMVDFFLKNYASYDKVSELTQISDTILIKQKYFEYLQDDSLFTAVFIDWMDKTLHNKVKDTVSLNDLLSSAVKFFSIRGITENGHYKTAICIGRHDLRDTETERKPFLEAFAFASIFEHINDEFALYDEFTENIKKLYGLHLAKNKEEQLLRAQGAIYFAMMHNEKLRSAILVEYEKLKKTLPFVLIDR